ncbi:MAG: S-layer homology domain-containing protein [Desulfitobacteriaceae bacterium]|nr:S-layer homology domain-containing protein [Desulfitobacteriaceae bacterium]
MQKRNVTLWLVLCLCIALLVPAQALAQEGDQVGFTDTSGHWAAEAISEWAEKGLVGGYSDGSFQPDAGITRAEFMAIVNRAMGFKETVSVDFSDVESSDWYFAEIGKAVKAGYITGYQDGTMQPKNQITRQEVATIISRLIKLDGDLEAIQSFADRQNIGAWCEEMVGAVVTGGYMGGYPDGTFQPKKPITRAETVTVLQRVTGELYNTPGTYGPAEGTQTIEGNVTISVDGITLQNTEINGVLHLTAGIGDGDVLLKNVIVNGTTVVSGGGENSIVLDETVLDQVIVDRTNGKVRIFAKNGSSIKIVVMQSAGILESETETTVNAFGEVVVAIASSDIPVELAGDCDSIRLESAETIVNVAAGTKVGSLEIAETAVDSQINLAQGSTVTNLDVNAAANINGSGTIITANVNTDGAVIEPKPEKVVVAPETSVIIDGKEVSEDAEEEPSGGGGGGGGGDTTKPTIESASLTTTAGSVAAVITDGKDGVVDFTSLTGDERVLSGTINVSEAATLTLTSQSLLVELLERELDHEKKLSKGENNLNVFDYLGGADGSDQGDEGVTLGLLSFLLADSDGNITLTGTLKDGSGNSNTVTLTILLP